VASVTPIAAFTGLRGVAALWVVAYHFREALIGSVPRLAESAIGVGYLAVDMFFILSGFVITLNYGKMFGELSLGNAKIFVLARFARLYPVHLFMSLVYLLNPLTILLFSTSKDLGARYGAGYYLLSLLLMQNWGLTTETEWNIPAWSISTEWFAYLMFPALLAGSAIRRETPAVLVAAVIALMVALFGLFIAAGAASIGADIPRLGLPRCLLEFMAGIGLCRLYLATRAPTVRAQTGLLATASAGAIATALFGLPDFLFLPAAFCLVVLSLAGESSVVCRLLSSGPLLFLGEISYSLYMVHYFVRDWVKFAAGDNPGALTFLFYVVLAIAAGFVLNGLVEKPGRSLFRSLALRKA
jgi:peptidoglycan/LPS O-acetylase OafA/YrhL